MLGPVIGPRLVELAFIYQHLDDVCSDMSAIHGVPDIRTMSGAAFARYAWRLVSYQGRMAAVVQKMMERQPASVPQAASPAPGTPAVEGTPDVLLGHHAAGPAPQLQQDAPVFSYATTSTF